VLFEGCRGDTNVTGIVVSNGETEETVVADAYLFACDVPGIKRLIPEEWRQWPLFDNIYKLEAVPVATVQIRFDGWVTEMQDAEARQATAKGRGVR
jgi:zeta-carotene desaturase